MKRISLHSVPVFAFVLVMLCTLFSCGGEAPVSEDGVYGDGIKNDRYVTFKSVLADLATQDTVKTTMVATVNEVCQAKGCWMTLQDGKQGQDEIMVRFKDYGFFVPKDLGGKQVMVEGKAFKTVVPVEELRHYAEDAGKSKEEVMQITEPEQSYRFEATGVKVLDN